nr:MAG: helix-turn-helix domain protein [Bacteriophage sp.]
MLRKVVKSMFSTFERIKELAKARGITLGALEEKLGLSRNSIYTIKNKKPSAERLQLIADYFGVSTDYLLGRTDNPRIATEADQGPDDIDEIIANAMMFDGKPLTDDDKRAIRGIIAGYMSSKGDV